jgi:hypothetical protein
MHIMASGAFSVNAELDVKYIIVPIDFARELFGMENEISAIEFKLTEGADEAEVKAELEKILPVGLKVQTRYDRNALVYKTNASEKWFTFLILFFILVIASFNIIASLTMLIIEKKKDIYLLESLGAIGFGANLAGGKIYWTDKEGKVVAHAESKAILSWAATNNSAMWAFAIGQFQDAGVPLIKPSDASAEYISNISDEQAEEYAAKVALEASAEFLYRASNGANGLYLAV